MSDIRGEGYGSEHDWKRDITDTWGGTRGTRYFCRDCKFGFIHFYDIWPDIFEAMQDDGVPERCVVKLKAES